MNFPVIFDVAIGIVVIYFISSLILSFIIEFVIVRRNWRGDFLYKQLRGLFYNSQGGLYNMIEKMYRHPLISKLQQYAYRFPENIDSITFSKTFIAVLHEIGDETIKWEEVKLEELQNKVSKLKQFDNKNQEIGFLEDKIKEIEENRKKYPIDNAANNNENIFFRAISNERYFDGEGKRLIDSFVKYSNGSDASLEERIASWYDSYQERLQYLFKREVKFYLFFYSLAYCAIVNVDTISIYNELLNDSSKRESMIVMANEIGSIEFDSASTLVLNPIRKELLPILHDTTLSDSAKINHILTKGNKVIKVSYGEASSLIGWNKEKWAQLWKCNGCCKYLELFWKALGILISACALMFGAPFWHDYLKSMLAVRKIINPKATK